MSRYLLGWALVGVLALDQLVITQAFAGDGEVIVTREVPYQSWSGVRYTGRANAIDVSPDAEVISMTNQARITGALAELSDRESSVISTGMGRQTTGVLSGLQHNPALEALAAGKTGGASPGAQGPSGGMGAATSNLGAGISGSVGRTTDALTNTLSGAMFRPAGMK